jgi:hypothetical protein
LRLLSVSSLVLLLIACTEEAPSTPNLPSSPAHGDSQGGRMHALGKSSPFLCDAGTTACPDTEPETTRLSCDSIGCHGDFDYTAGTLAEDRHLHGSDGPSCYACHDKLWSSRQTP